MAVMIDVKVRAPSGRGSGSTEKLINTGISRGVQTEKMAWRLHIAVSVTARALYSLRMDLLSAFLLDAASRYCSYLHSSCSVLVVPWVVSS